MEIMVFSFTKKYEQVNMLFARQLNPSKRSDKKAENTAEGIGINMPTTNTNQIMFSIQAKKEEK